MQRSTPAAPAARKRNTRTGAHAARFDIPTCARLYPRMHSHPWQPANLNRAKDRTRPQEPALMIHAPQTQHIRHTRTPNEARTDAEHRRKCYRRDPKPVICDILKQARDRQTVPRLQGARPWRAGQRQDMLSTHVTHCTRY